MACASASLFVEGWRFLPPRALVDAVAHEAEAATPRWLHEQLDRVHDRGSGGRPGRAALGGDLSLALRALDATAVWLEQFSAGARVLAGALSGAAFIALTKVRAGAGGGRGRACRLARPARPQVGERVHRPGSLHARGAVQPGDGLLARGRLGLLACELTRSDPSTRCRSVFSTTMST